MNFTLRMIEFINFLNKCFLLVTQYRRLVNKAKLYLFAKLDYLGSIKTNKMLRFKVFKTFVETKGFEFFLNYYFFSLNTFVRKSNQKAQKFNVSYIVCFFI